MGETRRQHFDRLERAALAGVHASLVDTIWLCDQVTDLEVELRTVGRKLMKLERAIVDVSKGKEPPP